MANFAVVDLQGRPAQFGDELGDRYGIDLRFPGDFVVRGSGDLERTRGLEALKGAFSRALITSPGELFWRPGYGVGATEFLNLPASLANLESLKNRIRRTLGADPAVESFDELRCTLNGEQLDVDVRVVVGGVRERITLGVRRA